MIAAVAIRCGARLATNNVADNQPKRLLWGLPMLPYFEEHQGMHALAFGPEGDLCFSCGEILRLPAKRHWRALQGPPGAAPYRDQQHAGIRRVLKKDQMASRELQDRSPMPEGLIQTPAELRDLLAFLLAQK